MTEHNEQYVRMTREPVAKLILSLSAPTILSMLVTSIYNIADTYFVSKIGTSASGAIGVVLAVMAMLQAVGFTIGMGGASQVSIFLGEEKQEQADEYAVSAIVMSVVFGVVFMIAGLWWKAPLMKLLGSTPTILPYAITYSTYIFIASPFMCTSFVLNNLLRAEGKAKLAMIGILSGGVLNVFLAPVLIFGCSLGIAGAGISTAVGQGISCGILLYWFFLVYFYWFLFFIHFLHRFCFYLVFICFNRWFFFYLYILCRYIVFFIINHDFHPVTFYCNHIKFLSAGNHRNHFTFRIGLFSYLQTIRIYNCYRRYFF